MLGAAPISDVTLPEMADLTKMVIAVGNYTSAGASAAITLTINDSYPPINLDLQSPILGIWMEANETAKEVGDTQIFLPTGQIARGTAADSAGEFDITGARTVRVFNTPDKNGQFLIAYIPKGTGNKR